MLPSTGERFIASPVYPSPTPGGVPSCLLFDETYPLHSSDSDLPEVTDAVVAAVPSTVKVPEECSWGVVSLAYNPTFTAPSERNSTLKDNNWGMRMNRLQRRAFEQLPLPERYLDFVEVCAMEAAVGAPTREELQQNVASMEVFSPGWSQYLEDSRLVEPLPRKSQEVFQSIRFSREVNSMMRDELLRSGERGGWPGAFIPSSHHQEERKIDQRRFGSASATAGVEIGVLGRRLRDILEKKDFGRFGMYNI